MPLVLDKPGLYGSMKVAAGDESALAGAKRYVATRAGDALVYRFEPGALAGNDWLWADFLLEGQDLAVFQVALYEPKLSDGTRRTFRFTFGLLNQCSARLRMPLDAVNQNQWGFNREGACLKRLAGGDRVDLARVEQVTLSVLRKSDEPVTFGVTAVTAQVAKPAAITKPLLPKGPLLDELGQSAQRQWAAKTRSVEALKRNLARQLEAAPGQAWPGSYGKWGGWTGVAAREASGFFRTWNDGRRWWLVDPEGRPFWSAGMDSVRPDITAAYQLLESGLTFLPDGEGPYGAAYARGRRGESPMFNYLIANFVRAFGAEKWYDAWGAIALGQMKQWGFNTVANWSDWKVARAAGFPYVRPLQFRQGGGGQAIYRDFPDVFSPTLEAAAEAYAKQLEETRDDKALIGYFLMNEPTWGFASETPAAGMLYTHASSHTRDTFATWLAEKYQSDGALAAGWNLPGATLAGVASGKWDPAKRLDRAARADCAEFSTLMVRRYFDVLSAACKKVDPNHLNLGARYHTVPPPWALKGMTGFDVFSINCYQDRVPPNQVREIAGALNIPVLIGEYHFGALDAGLPASGIGRVATQADRGKAFRVYVETAAALPECVGVHYFTLYDQSAIGRFDGENYNIGFLDTCNVAYEGLARAARETHERVYEVAAGKVKAYEDAPKYLSKVFA